MAVNACGIGCFGGTLLGFDTRRNARPRTAFLAWIFAGAGAGIRGSVGTSHKPLELKLADDGVSSQRACIVHGIAKACSRINTAAAATAAVEPCRTTIQASRNHPADPPDERTGPARNSHRGAGPADAIHLCRADSHGSCTEQRRRFDFFRSNFQVQSLDDSLGSLDQYPYIQHRDDACQFGGSISGACRGLATGCTTTARAIFFRDSIGCDAQRSCHGWTRSEPWQ